MDKLDDFQEKTKDKVPGIDGIPNAIIRRLPFSARTHLLGFTAKFGV